MKNVVADASVVLRWFLPDEDRGERALDLLEKFVREELRIIAPALLFYEVLNGLLVAARRGRLGAERAAAAFGGFLALEIESRPAEDPGLDVLGLAEAAGVSAYDAAYAALAHREKAEFVTADRRLYEALKGRGIEVRLL